ALHEGSDAVDDLALRLGGEEQEEGERGDHGVTAERAFSSTRISARWRRALKYSSCARARFSRESRSTISPRASSSVRRCAPRRSTTLKMWKPYGGGITSEIVLSRNSKQASNASGKPPPRAM